MKKVKLIGGICLVSILIAALCIPMGCMGVAEADKGGKKAHAGIPEPNEFLGVELGADYTMVDYGQLVDYYTELAAASSRVSMEYVGETSYGAPMYMMAVSSPDNLAKLDTITANHKLLASGNLDEATLNHLLKTQPAVLWVHPAMHATEVASTQMMPLLAYDLAVSNDSDIQRLLDDVVLYFGPSANPDGHDLVTHWYWDSLGTAWEGSSPPVQYQKYSGHDNNRDWFMMNCPETRVWTGVLYRDSPPLLIYDLHQMGYRGARFFVPPYYDPPNPLLTSSIIIDIELVGAAIQARLSEKGLKGVVTSATYDAWWHGGFSRSCHMHNVLGLITEAAGVRIASPRYIEFESLGGHKGLPTAQQRYVNFPDVWPGGEWHLSDLMAYEYETVIAYMDVAQKYREDLLRRFYLRNADGIEKGLTESPYAFVFPSDQEDLGSMEWMMELLAYQQMKVYKSEEPFSMGGKAYPAGSYVIPTSQPDRPNVMIILTPQDYPPQYEYEGGPPIPPYDVAAWTLPLQMGVEVDEVTDGPISLDGFVEVTSTSLDPGKFEFNTPGEIVGEDATYGYAFGPERNDSTVARLRLLDAGFDLAIAEEAFTVAGEELAPGSTVVPQASGLDSMMEEIAEDVGITAYALDVEPTVDMRVIDEMPRVGLYTSWRANKDTGWLRYVLESFEFEFERLFDADILADDLDEFDILLFADESRSRIRSGNSPGSRPAEYCGGLGDTGIAIVEEFIRDGGTVFLIDDAADLAIEDWGAPVVNIADGLPRSEFYCPGSILKVEGIDSSHPITYGYNSESIVYFHRCAVFEITGEGPVVLASYPADSGDIMLSGWIIGEELLESAPVLLEYAMDDGKVIMAAFLANNRAQPHETFKLIFNAIFDAAVSE